MQKIKKEKFIVNNYRRRFSLWRIKDKLFLMELLYLGDFKSQENR
jgi:hypothetical protein